MRGLASGEKGFEKLPKAMADFVFLNVYCTSVADEEKPRGPEGPYRFVDRSVPVVVIKRWDGETLHQQLGFVADPATGRRNVANWIESARKKNGPVTAPKKMRPLLKAFEKAEDYVEKKREGYAHAAFEKCVALGANEKEFPEGPPSIALKARERATAIEKVVETELARIEALEDEKERKTERAKLLRRFTGSKTLTTRIRE